MVTRSGHRGVVCATDETAARVEDLQMTLGEGPCVDAVSTGAHVFLDDLGTGADPWPGFLEGAAAAGVRAVFAFPLRIGSISIGALDLYRDEPGELAAPDVRAAHMAADAAAHAVLELGLDGGTFADDRESRSAYQMQVHQATGMVQEQLGIRTEEAFLLLRARAFASGRLVGDVATDVVARRLRFSTEDV